MAAHAAAQCFLDSALWKDCQHIACYMASDDEFTTNPIIQIIYHANKKCYLPILAKEELKFVQFQPGDPLSKNRYRILEPIQNEPTFPKKSLDVVLMPLVAFDRQGNRLGMGGGYYDQTFVFCLEKKVERPWMIGVGFALQEVSELPHDPWDVPLDGVLTEKGLVLF